MVCCKNSAGIGYFTTESETAAVPKPEFAPPASACFRNAAGYEYTGEKIMVTLKRVMEFDCAGSDMLPAAQAEPLRRKAFCIRGENGKPRAFVLSLLVHVSIGAALCFQLVPQQFIRISGSGTEQKLLEVLLISEPAGAAGGEQKPQQAVTPAPAAVREQAVKAEKKPEPIKKEPVAYTLHKKKEVSPPAVQMQAEEAPAGEADAAAASRQPAQATGAQGSDGRTDAGSGSGSGAPYDTSFGQADAPRFLQYAQPRYPLAARQQGREGTVVLRLTIDDKGTLVQVEIISSPSDGFAQAAVEAVKRSTFAPAQRDGKAVASRAVLPMRFALRH